MCSPTSATTRTASSPRFSAISKPARPVSPARNGPIGAVRDAKTSLGGGSVDAAELVVEVGEEAVGIEGLASDLVGGAVVDLPEALAVVVAAADERLDAAELVRLL